MPRARPCRCVRGPVTPVPAKEVLALGAVGSVPAGLGVVEGGVIPYKPEAKKQRDENKADWIHRDPEIKCYLPGVRAPITWACRSRSSNPRRRC